MTIDWLTFLPIAAFIILAVLVADLVLGAERRHWNRGRCSCGKPWRYFDTDSYGSRGYTCDDCHRAIWITSPGIDSKKEPLA